MAGRRVGGISFTVTNSQSCIIWLLGCGELVSKDFYIFSADFILIIARMFSKIQILSIEIDPFLSYKAYFFGNARLTCSYWNSITYLHAKQTFFVYLQLNCNILASKSPSNSYPNIFVKKLTTGLTTFVLIDLKRTTKKFFFSVGSFGSCPKLIT